MTSVTLEMYPLSPARADDFMSFFDSEAFTDNPKWSSCYCQCFLVAPKARGRGVATALLDRACETLRAQGLTYIEANPRPSATGSAENHFGPLSMYLAAGFSIRRTDADSSAWVGRDL